MRIFQKFTNTFSIKIEKTLQFVVIFALFGTILELTGGIWDAISHIQIEREFFWTFQHITIYSGIGLTTLSGVLGLLIIRKKTNQNRAYFGLKLIIIGSILQIIAGVGDSQSHEIFGIDGLISISHQTLELGLILSSLGVYFTIINFKKGVFVKFVPLSIMVLIFSISWLVFNLSLLYGNVLLCLPIYEIFSSGCAIL